MRAKPASGGLVQLVRASARDFSKDQCGLRAAALCYYTVFALPPLLILLITVAGFVWSPDAIQHAIESQFGGLIGPGGARTVRDMVASGQHGSRGIAGTVLGAAGLILGATGVFLALQNALNAAWKVAPDPKSGGVKQFITKRLLSLGMVMGLGFVLVVSLALTAALSALGGMIGNGAVMQVVSLLLSTAILAVIFAAIFKFLPDAIVAWRSVWVGGIATAVLFEIGKFAIGLYLGHSHPGDAFGGASALAVILVWIYYAGMLVLFGAEFTHNFAESRGHAIEPKAGAIQIVRTDQIMQGTSSEPSAQGETKMREEHGDARAQSVKMLPAEGSARSGNGVHDASIGQLFKQLSADSNHLVQQEIALAKVEVRETAATAAAATAKIGVAAVLALPGLMALTAALVIGVGILINSYWVSATIVGVLILAVAGVLAKRALAAFKSDLAPTETIRTVRDDAEWAKQEVGRVKQELSA